MNPENYQYYFFVDINPAFWQTDGFKLLVILLLSIATYYISQQIRSRDLLLREQRLIIEKKEAIENERSRIAAEMHDDLGGGLTTIKFLSQRALKNVSDSKLAKDINKIGRYSTRLVQNLSEIIWAMNAQFDTLEGLVAYIRNYAYEFLEDNQIALSFPLQEKMPVRALSGEKRRNIYLVIKEALNNCVKHSKANEVRIIIRFEDDLIIRIMDNGTGLPKEIGSNGIGLNNMKKRMNHIGGTCTFKNIDGLSVELRLPMP